MDADFINPFISAVTNTMETVVGFTPERFAPYLKKDALVKGDVTGIIGFTEKNITGSVSMSLTTDTAIYIHNQMTGDLIKCVTPEVQDSVGELTNTVAGGAKQDFTKMGFAYHISIPTIIVGRNHTLHHQLTAQVLAIPFKLENHPFLLELSLKTNN